MRVSIASLFAGLAGTSQDVGLEVSGVTLDSRKATKGDLFLACRGTRSHGLDYLSDVLAAGVRAVAWEPCDLYPDVSSLPVVSASEDLALFPVVNLSQHVSLIADRFYQHPSGDMSVIGITGTDGKTSTSYFLAQALGRLTRQDCGLIGTLGTGRLGELVSSGHTTPDAIRVQALLAEMRDQQMSHVAMEVSSHALDQGRVSAVNFAVVALTNLTRDHLDYHGTLEAYRQAKQQLFYHESSRLCVLNIDDDFGRALSQTLSTTARVVTYGFSRSAEVCGYDFQRQQQGFSLSIMTPWGGGVLDVNLLGDFNASNLMAVLAILLSLGYPFESALAALQGVRPVPGRMECFKVPGAPLAVVDFAHTPNALAQVLKALRPYCERGKLWCVFGCGGDRDRGKRPEMGEMAYQWADELVITSDNPRSEDPLAILADIRAGIPVADRVTLEVDRARAIEFALTHAAPEDVVLVAGKGHETVQIMADQTIPFDDRERVVRILEALQP